VNFIGFDFKSMANVVLFIKLFQVYLMGISKGDGQLVVGVFRVLWYSDLRIAFLLMLEKFRL